MAKTRISAARGRAKRLVRFLVRSAEIIGLLLLSLIAVGRPLSRPAETPSSVKPELNRPAPLPIATLALTIADRSEKERAMLPDFTVIQDYGEWTFRATTDRARRWLDESTTVFGLNVLVRTDELIVAKEMAKRVWRTLSEEGFQMVTLYHGHDFADQQSALLMARAIANAGKSQDALHRLVDLRDDLVNDPTNPKAATLLVEVDRAIDYAFGICRTDRQAAPAVSESTRGGALLPRLRRTMREFDGLVVHTAISIILVVDVYNVIHNLTHV